MEYALYNGLRTAAQPALKGICEHCGGDVIAKCGSKKIWHWAHVSIENCDSWYEPETAWHRSWKHAFGESCSEIRVVKENLYHIADVINKNGIVFEFQNSSISSEMIAAREQFYGEKMVWVIHGQSFKNNFRIRDETYINHWEIKILNEFDSAQNYPAFNHTLIIEDWRVKNEHIIRLLKQIGFMHSTDASIYYLPLNGVIHKNSLEEHIGLQIKELYEKHKLIQDFTKSHFIWLHPRRSWEEAQRPVFIDFGEDYLYRVIGRMGKDSGTGTKIRKKTFIEKYG